MENIGRVIEYIGAVSGAECSEIAKQAEAECARLRAEYFQTEQSEYWKAINAGGKETEQRLKQLSILAAEEANKQVIGLRQEMFNEAMLLAAKKLRELPDGGYDKLLARLGKEPGHEAHELVMEYTDELSESVLSALFD